MRAAAELLPRGAIERHAGVRPSETFLYCQPTVPDPLNHCDDKVNWPRAMGVEFPFPGSLTSTFPYVLTPASVVGNGHI